MHNRRHRNHGSAEPQNSTARKRVRSLLVVGAVLLLILGGGGAIRILLADDLLRHATRIADQRDWSSHTYFWLPPASRVRLIAPPTGDWYLAEKTETELLEVPLLPFTGSLFRESAITLRYVDSGGASSSQDRFDTQNSLLFGLSLSPNGRWLLCPVFRDGQVRILLEEIRTQKQHFCADLYADVSLTTLAQTWTPDSSTCVTTSLGRDCALLRIRNVQTPDRVRSVHVHGNLGDDLLGITADGKLLSTNAGSSHGNPALLLSTDLTASSTSVNSIDAHFPSGQHWTEVALSPHGDRLLWITKAAPAINSSKFPHWVRRFLGSRILPSVTFWVTRTDGSGLSRVGSIALSEDTNWDEWPMAPHWLPDGAHASFTYHETLWTVPIDTALR